MQKSLSLANHLKLLTDFFRTAPLPCICCLISFAILLFFILSFMHSFEKAISFFKISGAIFFFSSGLCSLADGICRYHEYTRILHIFKTYGVQKRVLAKVSSSRCQRDAVLFAAQQAGVSTAVKSYFSSQGYRWYHILPDPIADNPLHFFKPSFLSSTFFPKKRRSNRIDRPKKNPKQFPSV